MKPIKFTKEETKAIVGEIQDYFREELDQQIGSIPAALLTRRHCLVEAGFSALPPGRGRRPVSLRAG